MAVGRSAGPPPADITQASQEYEQSEKKLIQFVEKQVELMRSNLLFSGREPSFYELQQSLSQFESVAIGLTSLYATVRAEHDFAQERYDDFYADKFIEERDSRATLSSRDRNASSKEIEMAVRKKHMVPLAQLRSNVLELENRRSFVERMIDSWRQYSFIINTLSANARAEAEASRQNPNDYHPAEM